MAERKKTVQSTRRSNSAPKKGNNSRKTTAMPKKETAVPKKGKGGRPRKTDYQKPERIENPGNEGFSVWDVVNDDDMAAGPYLKQFFNSPSANLA